MQVDKGKRHAEDREHLVQGEREGQLPRKHIRILPALAQHSLLRAARYPADFARQAKATVAGVIFLYLTLKTIV